MSKDQLCYTLVMSEKSPLEDNYMKYLKNVVSSHLNERIKHIRLLVAKKNSKITNVKRSNIFKQINELKKIYAKRKHESQYRKIIKRIVEIINDLYNKQKQHITLQHHQTYFRLKDLKYLFESDDTIDYDPVFVRSSLKNKFEEYEINGSKKILSSKEYLTCIYLWLKKLIYKKQVSTKSDHKGQLKTAVVFTKVNSQLEKQVQYVDSDSLKLRNGDDVTNFIKYYYDFLLKIYIKKEISLRGSNFIFNGIDLTLTQFIKLKLKLGGSYIPRPDWINVKKAIINPQNTKDKFCFEYSIIPSIRNKEIGKNIHRISKLKPFINNYNWNETNYPAEQKDWDKFECNNKDIWLNTLSMHSTKKKFNIRRTSKVNKKGKHEIILLI